MLPFHRSKATTGRGIRTDRRVQIPSLHLSGPRLVALALLLIFAFLNLAATPAGAATTANQRCFAETGYCISGPILRYWERNGGLAVFGFPITPQRLETVEDRTLQVQWFERDRLEIQSDGTITAGRLGARILELQGRRWEQQPRLDPPPPDGPSECQYFAQTGQQICEPFLGYWRANGGVTRFGYPLSSVRLEELEGRPYTLQYFERRRIEHHPEFAGTPYEYLYGLLGREVLAAQAIPGCAGPPRDAAFGLEERISYVAFRPSLLCPSESYAAIPASFQQFMGGVMLWVDLGAAGRYIYVHRYQSGTGQGSSYVIYPDTYQEGEPPIDEKPPEVPPRQPIKPQIPQRGFGKVWAAGEREYLGYAIAPEYPQLAHVQRFANGGTVIWLLSEGRIWSFGPLPQQTVWN
ncbi:MAG: hypothetical protein AB4911_11975 [Oscillochloridaceae bacterium umkhey_bin13]